MDGSPAFALWNANNLSWEFTQKARPINLSILFSSLLINISG